MSTRAHITVKKGYDSLLFYKHNDGYPEGVMPILERFMDNVKKGNIRDNVEQSSGWLIIFGREEMPSSINNNWKASLIEPSCFWHDDVEFHYIVDLENKEIIYEST